MITLQGQSTISCTEVNHLSEIFQGACAIVHTLLLFRLNRILPHYLTEGKIFRKTLLKHRMWVLSFSKSFVKNISHSKKNSATYYHKCAQVFMYCTVILVKYQLNLNTLDRFSKNTQIPCKSFQWEPSCFMRTDRQTDHRFWQFCLCA